MFWCMVTLALFSLSSPIAETILVVADRAFHRLHPFRRHLLRRLFLPFRRHHRHRAYVPEETIFEISMIVRTMLFPDVKHAKAVANLIQNASQVIAVALHLPIMVVAAVVPRVRGGVFQIFNLALILTKKNTTVSTARIDLFLSL